MVWVRVLIGAVWLNGSLEKLLNPSFPQFMRMGELMLGIALILGLLTNLAALGSVGLSAAILLSQGGVGLGTGLGAPEFLTINVLVALLSVVILLSPAAKSLSIDSRLAERSPTLSPLLTNRSRQD